MLYDPSKEYNEVGQVLLKAAKRVEEFGHLKGTLGGDGATCLYGAVLAAAKLTPDPDIRHECVHALGKAKGIRHLDVNMCRSILIAWNDSKETTAQQVIDLLRETAELCKVT